MPTYYMTSYRHSEVGYWQKCKAATLAQAKREATRQYGDGFLDAVLTIAEGDDIEPRRTVAVKSNRPHSRWFDMEI